MLRYRQSKLVRSGVIGLALIVLLIAVGLNPERLVSLASSVHYQALFADGGGLTVGNDVTKAGVKVGSVSGITLERGKALATFSVKGSVGLGSDSTAHIRTGSVLGERLLDLVSVGAGRMAPASLIPDTRTSSPYSLTEAVSDLTTNTEGTDTASLNQSLDTLSATIDQIAPQLGPTFDGLTRLSRSLNGRNDALRALLDGATDVTGVLAERSDQLNTLILDGNALAGVLNERRQVIVDLLGSTSALSQQISGLVADNEEQLAPALDKLNEVTAMLEKNRDNIAKILPGLVKYQLSAGETVANGHYYNANIPNLISGQFTQPFLDYLLGFRRGTTAGQPPGNPGPRAELPFPYNGIPGGTR